MMENDSRNRLVLDVNPDINSNPEVTVSNRSPKGKVHIRWIQTGSDSFTMKSLSGDSAVFTNIVISNSSKQIDCDFTAKPGDPADTDYPYTLTITYDCKDYNTDEKSNDPDPGRAVIRN